MLDRPFALIQTPWLSLLVGSALAIYGIVISVKARPRKRLSYVIAESVVLGVSNPTWQDKLEIKYSGTLIKRLTACRIGIWNSGNTTIHGSQIVKSDGLRIALEGEEILLDAVITSSSRPILGAKVEKKGENVALLEFDYLDPGDGFVVHTAQSSQQGQVRIAGTLRELEGGATIWSSLLISRKWSTVIEVFIGPAMATILLLISTIARSAFKVKDGSTASLVVSILFLIALLVTLGSSGLVWRRIRLAKARSIPKAVRDDPSIKAHLTAGLL